MGNCQTKKATSGAVAAPPASSSDQRKPREATSTNASDTEPGTPEKANVVVLPSQSHDAVVQSAISADASHGGAESTIISARSDLHRDSSAKSSVVVPLAPTVDASTVVSASAKTQKRRGDATNKEDEYDDYDEDDSFLANETVTTREEQPKSFMDQLDSLRDSCCGGGAGAGAASATLNEQYNDAMQNENDKEEETTSRNMTTTHSEEEEDDETPNVAADTYPLPGTGESLEKEQSSVSKGGNSFMSRMRSNSSTKESGVNKAASNDSSAIQSLASSSVGTNDPNYKQKRKLNKKLREIAVLEAKDFDSLTVEEREKMESKASVMQSLKELEDE
mmetsp:Transcript_9900/g.18615  ORF Transcript_9900/g.18615 Transcript_9900/m.18615 type:complete len:335 (-) Transcript_9900:182-1186(-)|eukprot:CAMPEP_0176486046 /NCGR_PEP_ID=MMETSP0200_2-20121128/5360_1 /TAXON_ID=947934 /ORGANISM="Chaetoceros sp., Strain GSL56" /LENGTH=334 /DNA_ID=CAMNT_0017882723 /DNA_START=119 /DNA_END=1123 /DNA_ORIENTATION=+